MNETVFTCEHCEDGLATETLVMTNEQICSDCLENLSPKSPSKLDDLSLREKFVGIEALYNWGLNYEYAQNPFTFFLDLIGFSEENYGEKLVPKANLDYLGLDYLADALKEYVVCPDDARTFIQALLDSEIVEGDN